MTDTIRCPDCGTENPPEATACSRCNYPLVPAALPGVPPASPTAAEAPPPDAAPATPPAAALAGATPAADPPLTIERPLRRPSRPQREPQSGLALSIWLFVGGFAALLLIFMGVKANVDRANEPIEGSNQAQQQRADELQAMLARDSTDIEARQRLADLYYDTSNWTQAITHYRRVVQQDSSRVTALVDLGVCTYNLGDAKEAERLFQLALRRDPHQPIALFNMGIVSERREDYESALRYYHAAMQSDPPENMNEALMQAMQRIQEKTGRSPGPLKP